MKKALFLVVMSSLFMGCSSESDDSNSGTITMKYNGEQISAKVTSVTLYYVGGDGKRLDITAENNSKVFQIAFASTNTSEEFNTNEYNEENANLDDNQALFYVSYKVGGNTYGEHMPSDISIHKTGQDTGKNLISGTFTAVLDKVGSMQDEVETPEQIVVTEGKFTNLKYTEIN
ncbi:MAG: hypothetical protein V4670_03645 [Bacteroidota bacterium]